MNKKVGIIAAVAGIVIVLVTIFATQSSDSMDSMEMSNTSRQSATQNQDADEVKSGSVAIDIKDFDFQTMKLRVKPGTTVTWTNRDDAKHDISPDSGNFEGSGKLLTKGQSYSYTFQTPGTYAYHCSPHPYMKASVEVVE